MSGYTKIGEVADKICAEVCTLYVKGSGCQAALTSHLRDGPEDRCPVGKELAERWYFDKEAQKKK